MQGVNGAPLQSQQQPPLAVAGAAAAVPVAAAGAAPAQAAEPKTSFQAIATAPGVDLAAMSPKQRADIRSSSYITNIETYQNEGVTCCRIFVERKVTFPEPTGEKTVLDTLETSVQFPNPPDEVSIKACKQVLTAMLAAYDARLLEGLKDPEIGKQVAKEEGLQIAIAYDKNGDVQSAEVKKTITTDPATRKAVFTAVAKAMTPVVFTDVLRAQSLTTQSTHETTIKTKVNSAIDIISKIITPEQPPSPAIQPTIATLKATLAGSPLPPATINDLLTLIEREAANDLDFLRMNLQQIAQGHNATGGEIDTAKFDDLRTLHSAMMTCRTADPADNAALAAATVRFKAKQAECDGELFTPGTADKIAHLRKNLGLLDYFQKSQKIAIEPAASQADRAQNLQYLNNVKENIFADRDLLDRWLNNGALGKRPPISEIPAEPTFTAASLLGAKTYRPGSVTATATPAAAEAVKAAQAAAAATATQTKEFVARRMISDMMYPQPDKATPTFDNLRAKLEESESPPKTISELLSIIENQVVTNMNLYRSDLKNLEQFDSLLSQGPLSSLQGKADLEELRRLQRENPSGVSPLLNAQLEKCQKQLYNYEAFQNMRTDFLQLEFFSTRHPGEIGSNVDQHRQNRDSLDKQAYTIGTVRVPLEEWLKTGAALDMRVAKNTVPDRVTKPVAITAEAARAAGAAAAVKAAQAAAATQDKVTVARAMIGEIMKPIAGKDPPTFDQLRAKLKTSESPPKTISELLRIIEEEAVTNINLCQAEFKKFAHGDLIKEGPFSTEPGKTELEKFRENYKQWGRFNANYLLNPLFLAQFKKCEQLLHNYDAYKNAMNCFNELHFFSGVRSFFSRDHSKELGPSAAEHKRTFNSIDSQMKETLRQLQDCLHLRIDLTLSITRSDRESATHEIGRLVEGFFAPYFDGRITQENENTHRQPLIEIILPEFRHLLPQSKMTESEIEQTVLDAYFHAAARQHNVRFGKIKEGARHLINPKDEEDENNMKAVATFVKTLIHSVGIDFKSLGLTPEKIQEKARQTLQEIYNQGML